MPPVAAPVRAPTAVAASQPAATIGPRPGNGRKAQSREQAGAAADHTTDAGTGPRCGHLMDVGVFFADILVGHKADVAGGYAARFDGGDRIACLGVRIVNATNCCHDWILDDWLRCGLENDVALVIDGDLGGLAVHLGRTAPHPVTVLGDRSDVGCTVRHGAILGLALGEAVGAL